MNVFPIQFDVSNVSVSDRLYEENGFDRTYITDGPVRQLQWESGMEMIYAVTNTFVSFFFIFDKISIMRILLSVPKRFY